jgi:hypothetical protein
MCAPNFSGFWNTTAFEPSANSATSDSGTWNLEGNSKTIFISIWHSLLRELSSISLLSLHSSHASLFSLHVFLMVVIGLAILNHSSCSFSAISLSILAFHNFCSLRRCILVRPTGHHHGCGAFYAPATQPPALIWLPALASCTSCVAR